MEVHWPGWLKTVICTVFLGSLAIPSNAREQSCKLLLPSVECGHAGPRCCCRATCEYPPTGWSAVASVYCMPLAAPHHMKRAAAPPLLTCLPQGPLLSELAAAMCRAQGPSQALVVAAAEVTRRLPSLAYMGCVSVLCSRWQAAQRGLHITPGCSTAPSPQPPRPGHRTSGHCTSCVCCRCRLAVAAEDRQSVRYSALLSQRQGAARLGAVAASSCAGGLAIDAKQVVHVRDLSNG